MKLAAIACANGLGHCRRVISISTFMLKNGFSGYIDAYIPQTHVDALNDWPDCKYFVRHRQVKIFDFHYPKKHPYKTSTLFDHDWQTPDLPSFSKYDVVWSDNILQVLEQREDAIITGSFLWHEVFEKHADQNGLQSFVESQRELLTSVHPTMVGNEYFATPDVRSKTDFVPVGLYRYSLLFQEKKHKGILISCGLGGEEEDITRDAVSRIIEENIRPPDILFVESRLLPDKYPTWIKKADFSNEMFQYCAAVCIRPGMGTVSDSLISRNRVFTFSREDSFEMMHNSKVLEKLKVGQRSSNPYNGYLDALEYLHDPERINNQLLRTSHLRTDGVFATADLIISKC